MQQEIARDAVVEVRYVGNAARNLFQTIDGNPFIAGLVNLYPDLVPAGLTPCSEADAAVPEAVGRVDCNAGVVRERTNTSYSNYIGLQTELRVNRLWNQLTLKSSYTYSKNMDNASEVYSTGAAGGTHSASQNQLNFKAAEYSRSGLDFPNNWVLSITEEFPSFRSQQGWLRHVAAGWTVSGVYTISSGQPYTPSQAFANCASGGGACGGIPPSSNPYDPDFNLAFIGNDGALRPFSGNPRAVVDSVGIFAGDLCSFAGIGCDFSPTQLLSLNALNQGDSAGTPVTNQQVRYIANTAIANQVFGSPFGNVRRNSLRDFHTNRMNILILKSTAIGDRVHLQFHADFINAFNHPNYSSIDPFIEDAGAFAESTGFANPRVFNGGNRSIRFGVKWIF